MELLRNTLESFSQWWLNLHYTRNQKVALLGLSIVAIFISLLFVNGDNLKENSPEIITAIEVIEPKIYVDVTGAVKNPGVYALTGKSRVIDAIKAAGDISPGADLSTINLARVLNDGEQIYVDLASINTSGVRITKKINKGPVNINRATLRELDSLDGIGPVIAKRIIEYRKVNGFFITVDDLQKVSGIGAAKFAQIKSKVRV